MLFNNEHIAAGENNIDRFSALVRASLTALGADLFLIALKYSLSRFTGSTVLLADAWHSSGDLAVTLMVMFAIVINYRFKDKIWARKAEGIAAFIIFAVLVFGAANLFWKAVKGAETSFNLRPGIPLVIAIAGTGLAAGISFRMFKFKRKTGVEQDSPAFSAESFHTYSDFFSTVGVWAALVLEFFGIRAERLMTAIIALLIFGISLRILGMGRDFMSFKPKFNLGIFNPLPQKLTSFTVRCASSFSLITINFIAAVKKVVFAAEEWLFNRASYIFRLQFLIIPLLYFFTGFYSIQPCQTGMELFLGKVVERNQPGWHYHAPYPFGKVVKVDTGLIARVESGYRTIVDFKGVEPEAYLWEFSHNQGRYVKFSDEAITITGDENIIDVNMLCYFRIVDPVQFALKVDNSMEALRTMFSAETHMVLSEYPLDDLLTSRRTEVQARIRAELTDALKDVPLGVEILSVYMEEAHPPLDVVPQYRSVASAREKKDEIIHQATGYANDLIPHAYGKAAADSISALAYRAEKIAIASGEAAYFVELSRNFNQYQSSQAARLKWETLEKLIAGKKIYILPAKTEKRMVPAGKAPSRGDSHGGN